MQTTARCVSTAVVVLLAGACRDATPSAPAPAPTPASSAPRLDAVHTRVAQICTQIEGDSRLTTINRTERVHDDVRARVLEPWRQAFLARDAEAFGRLLTRPQASPAWASGARTVRRERGGIREFNWSLGAAAEAGEAARYLARFARVDDVRLDAVLMRGDMAAGPVTVDVRFDLRAVGVDGARREDRGMLEVDLVRVGAGWRIDRVAPRNIESLEGVVGRRPAYEDTTAAAGLDRVPITSRGEAIRRGGYAIAAADFDGDGRADLLVGNSGPVQLFRNTPQGFVEVTQAAGLAGETLVKAAAFADLNNDGLRDLVLMRFVDHAAGTGATDYLDGRAGDGDVVIYANAGHGRFERRSNVLSRHRNYDRAMPLAIADFDGNGTLDLYLGFPGARDFTNNLARGPQRDGVARQGMWLNDGGWNFREQVDSASLATAAAVYPHAALATDLDRDGRPDLIVVDDSGGVNPVYHNLGSGQMADVTERMGVDSSGWGMGVAVADINNDNLSDIVMTDVALTAGTRIEGDATGERHGRGLRLLRNRGDGQFERMSEDSAGLGYPGEAPAGAEFIDYDGDGLPDLYVANGLWSGGSEEADSFFMRLYATREGHDGVVADPGMSGPTDADPNPILTILRGFRGSLLAPQSAPTGTALTLSLGGYQRNRLFRNNGDSTFTEVGYFEGADRIEDGYVMAAVDYDLDGQQDLVLRNADPAPQHRFPPVVLLHHTAATNGLSVVPVGTRSNRDGIGAVVTALVGDRRLTREVRSASGAMQHEPLAYFGLGTATRADQVEVRWPSGRVERFQGAAAGRVTVTEGQGVAVTP